MDKDFINILKKLITEQGKEALLDHRKCKSYLPDYTGGDYKKESRWLLQAVEVGAARAIDSAGDLALYKKQAMRKLEEDEGFNSKAAQDIINALAFILRGDKTVTESETTIAARKAAEQQAAAKQAVAKQTVAKNTNQTNYKSLIEMVWIPPGKFLMGSPETETGRNNDETQHSVTLTQGFYMGKYQVTQKQWETIMGYNPSEYKGQNFPVEYVSWFDAVEFCNKLSVKEGLQPVYTITGRTYPTDSGYEGATVKPNWNNNGYRLPTEAQWEYACRAGTTTPWNTGANITTVQANFDEAVGRTTEVGSYPPNPRGLHDMHGNLWEWVWGKNGEYPSTSETDPLGESGAFRVKRGGSWGASAKFLRSAFRSADAPYTRRHNIGLRVVRPKNSNDTILSQNDGDDDYDENDLW